MAGVVFWDGVLDDAQNDLLSGRIGKNSRALVQDDQTIVGYTGADYDTNPWNVVAFDNIRLPGFWDVKGLAKCNVKNKKAPGSKGNKPTILGYQPIEFDLVGTIWTPNQWDIMQDEIDRLWNTPMANPHYIGKSKKIDPAQFTHAIDHPKLQAFKIAFCVINQFGLPRDGKDPGTMIFEIKCTENRDPGAANVTSTPKAAPVKRHHNFDGPQPKNSSQLPPPSQTPANMSLEPVNFTPAGGPF